MTAYERVLRERDGTAAFLVWGDPSLYDSTIRVVDRLAERMPLERINHAFDELRKGDAARSVITFA